MKLSCLAPVGRTKLPNRLARPSDNTLRAPVEGPKTAQQKNSLDVVEEWVQVNVILPLPAPIIWFPRTNLLRPSSPEKLESINLRTMTTHIHCREFSLMAIAIFFVALQIAPSGTSLPPLSAQSSKPAPCSAPEYHQFDFWLGDWDSFDFGVATKNARIRVERILDGCVLRENYDGENGRKGQSFSIYDASRKVWHQTWVTNRGELLTIEGQFEAGQMVLVGSDLTSTDQARQVRGTWKPVEGGIRETAVASLDSGKTWQPWFDLMFRPHSSGVSATGRTSVADDLRADDAKTVAALDTQFQAAVKANDAATIDRLLPDDYILVGSSGRHFTKEDLLEEARSGSRHYDHQEDTEQIVRVWGDTTVITAKLWAKGSENGKPFDYTLWFSDTYVRSGTGWRYAFGQASSPLPKPPLPQP
jgi:ketosteroid isomerase-like protein